MPLSAAFPTPGFFLQLRDLGFLQPPHNRLRILRMIPLTLVTTVECLSTGQTWRGTARTAAWFIGRDSCSKNTSKGNESSPRLRLFRRIIKEETEAEEGCAMTARVLFSAASRPTRRGTSNCCARPIAGPPSSTGVCRSECGSSPRK